MGSPRTSGVTSSWWRQGGSPIRLVDAAAGGLAVADRGQVITDDQLRTNVDGVWALGDITNPIQLKHVANHEARVVRHNLTNPDSPITVDHRFIPMPCSAITRSPRWG